MGMWVHWSIIWQILAWLTTATASVDVKPGCKETCGNISVPYPFGIGKNCAMNSDFLLFCNSSSDSSVDDQLIWGQNIQVLSVSIPDGTLTVSIKTSYDCYKTSGEPSDSSMISIILGSSGPFSFSATHNKFTAIGCDTMATVFNADVTYGATCFSSCDENVSLEKSSCSGIGCCQTSIPKNLKSLIISSDSIYNHTNVAEFNPCGYAFLVEEQSFLDSDWQLSDPPYKIWESNVVIEWAVENKTCKDFEADPSKYACGANAKCIDDDEGYRCSCNDGFFGNPYAPLGCEDIDECQDQQKYKCDGKCKNIIGNYTCQCPLGMHGHGKIGCKGFRITTIVKVAGASIFLVILSLLLYIICMNRRKDKNFRENGGLILKHQRVTLFTETELIKATRNYDRGLFLGEGGFGSVHRGILPDGTVVAVKKPKELEKTRIDQECQREIGIVFQVNHKNVVKPLGICLETKMPLLVYEFISNGTLFQHIHTRRSQILRTWRNRLRIAAETALALDYLHSLADPPIIHGDVKSMNIFLDNNYTAKVSDFGASMLVSSSQVLTIATKVQGTLGYLDPEYLMTGILTVKSDVYSFGVVLVELLTGEKPNCDVRAGEKRNIIQYFISSLENNRLRQIICFEVSQGEMEEIEKFAALAKQCLNPSGIRRPSMKKVAEELARLTKLHQSLWSNDLNNNEEKQNLLSEEFPYSGQTETTGRINKPGIISVASFSMEYPSV